MAKQEADKENDPLLTKLSKTAKGLEKQLFKLRTLHDIITVKIWSGQN